MHILYFHQHFSPPGTFGNNRSLELSEQWVKAGHHVTIVCGSGNFSEPLPFFSIYKIYYFKELKVIRLRTGYSHFDSFSKRIISFISYLFISLLLSVKWRKADLVYASSTPLTVGIVALWLKMIFGKRYVFETVDLWPDVPIGMGIIRNRLIVYALYKLECKIYKYSSHIFCLSEDMKSMIIAKGIDPIKVTVSHNGTNCEVFTPNTEKNLAKRNLNIEDNSFIVLYAGTIGQANNLEFLADVAEHVSQISNQNILFLILGEGNRKEKVQQYVINKELRNIIFLPSVPKNLVKNFFDAADAGFVCFAPFPILETNSANKFFDYLAAGLPTLINYGGWQKGYLEQYGAGFSHRSAFHMAQQIAELSENSEICIQTGCNARKLAEKHFNRSQISQIIARICTSIKSN